MGPYKYLCVFVDLYVNVIGAYASIWVFMNPYLSLFVLTSLDGSLMVLIRSYGSFWVFMRPYAS